MQARPPRHHLRRFFNGGLRDDYARCLLPTEEGSTLAVGHALPARLFDEEISLRNFMHTVRTPPGGARWPQGASLSTPFKRDIEDDDGDDADEPQDGADGAPRRRKRPKKRKKRPPPRTNGQKRASALDGHMRTAKVLMLPTPEQKAELRRCFRVCRFAYNWANECVREGFMDANFRRLRDRFRRLRMLQTLPYSNTRETAVHSSIVAYSIKQLADAYSSNFAMRRLNPAHRFHIKFRSADKRRTPTETLIIEKDWARDNYAHKLSTLLRFEAVASEHPRRGRAECLAFFGNNLARTGGIRLQDSERIIGRLVAEGNRLREIAKIHWDKRTDSFHFIYTYVIPKLPDPDPAFEGKRIVATDPGCRPFQAWYSPTSGCFGECLPAERDRLRERCLALDKLQSRIDRRVDNWRGLVRRRFVGLPPVDPEETRRRGRMRQNTARRLRQKLARERRRLHGWMASAHYDTANFLLRDHDLVLQPVLAVRRLAQGAARQFGSAVARRMYTWSHHLFRQRLKSAAARHPGRHVLEITEPATSKTCTHCGFWKADLRLGDRVFRCSHCGLHADRQLAGARNNFLAAYGLARGVGWDGIVVGGG